MTEKELSEPPVPLRRTPLYGLHVEHGARMVPFAGHEMPVSYPLGVLREHLHTRAASGLFDISHMGQIALWPKSGKLADAARALERLVPMDILGLEPGRQRYAYFTNERGGILDDLMVANLEDHLLLIVNAARKDADESHLLAHVTDQCRVERLDRSLIALQGPNAESVLARFAPECGSMRFMDVRSRNVMGARCIIARSGYTGEDGFEISVPNDVAREIAEAFLENRDAALIGLGARDSLRLEAGLCLYGSDIDEATSPVEAGLTWAIQRARRSGSPRAGRFPGAPKILQQIAQGAERRRVGLRLEGRAPVRSGAEIFDAEDAGNPIGCVTSGGFGPSLNRPVAMGYVNAGLAEPGRVLFAEVRGQRLPMTVTSLPFVTPNFKRG